MVSALLAGEALQLPCRSPTAARQQAPSTLAACSSTTERSALSRSQAMETASSTTAPTTALAWRAVVRRQTLSSAALIRLHSTARISISQAQTVLSETGACVFNREAELLT